MTDEQLISMETELEDELQLWLDTSDPSDVRKKNQLERHLKNGAFYLESKIGVFDIEANLTARSYVLNYARYAFYGVLDEFYANYESDLRGLQIENFEA